MKNWQLFLLLSTLWSMTARVCDEDRKVVFCLIDSTAWGLAFLCTLIGHIRKETKL